MISKDTPIQVMIQRGNEGCKSCGRCCTMGAGIVIMEEIPRLAKAAGMTAHEFEQRCLEPFEKFHTEHRKLRTIKKAGKPYGRCVLFDEKRKCTIHAAKPLHCRISNCGMESTDVQKWHDLNFFVHPHDPQSVREYAVWLEFAEALPGGELKELVPDQEKRKRILEYKE